MFGLVDTFSMAPGNEFEAEGVESWFVANVAAAFVVAGSVSLRSMSLRHGIISQPCANGVTPNAPIVDGEMLVLGRLRVSVVAAG